MKFSIFIFINLIIIRIDFENAIVKYREAFKICPITAENRNSIKTLLAESLTFMALLS